MTDDIPGDAPTTEPAGPAPPMRRRWMIAAGVAVALALVTLPLLDWRSPTPSVGGDAADGGVCDARTTPANLDFRLNDMHGAEVDVSAYRGNVILLNFWATWCGPCRYEVPIFVELQDEYRDRGFTVLGVSTDDPPDRMRQFAEEHRMNYPALVGRDDGAIMDAYGPIWAIPVSFIIDRDGYVCRKQMGIATKEQFERMIEAVL
jgi:peroxiredoxin